MASAQQGKPLVYLEEYKLKQDANDYGLADELWDFERFKQQLQIVVVRYEENELEFDMIGVNPAIANVFRRLMLSEVPSMAIEKVHIYNNTSIIQDEVLAHRLGLIPLRADPRMFEYKANETDPPTAQDSLEFERNHSIYSGQIKWVPIGNQATIYTEAAVGPIDDDILISKMRPGHEFDIKLFAVKGIGKDHAKFSPVATVSYRMLPDIQLTQPVIGNDARLLQKCFSPGVIEIDKSDQAYVKDARYDSCSRNVYRYPHLADAVKMARVRNHFIFTVESLGALKPDVIFLESVKVLKKKCRMFLDEIKGH
uniref:Putative rna polymerase i and iii subunit n=1 Tax=Anopheles darlingi TaxID=43151 RepID=A0A2M4CPM0_ANODA